MQWFQVKEKSVGQKRLIISLFLYRLLGKNILYIISFFVAFFTFLFASDIRRSSKKYLKITQNYTKIMSTLLNQFRHINSYASASVDKWLAFMGDFDTKNIIFEDRDMEDKLFSDLKNKKGGVFIFSHIGNIEILEGLLITKKISSDFKINIFMSNKQSKVFNNFLKSIKLDFPVEIFYIEDIGLDTGIKLEEKLKNGEIVFIAGDRLTSVNNKNIEANLFSHKIYLPKGVFRLAKIIDSPIYFISNLKLGNIYKVYLEKQTEIKEKILVQNYVNFLERLIKINPLQFFHFYDFFN